jgi:hypothetical protein
MQQPIVEGGYTPLIRSPGFKMSRMYYRLWGPKVGRFVDLYGASERAACLLLEGDPTVRKYCEQTPNIDEFINGKRLLHVFTFWVQYRDGHEELIEIVRKRDLVPNDTGQPEPVRWRDKCEWAATRAHNCRFIVEGTGDLRNHTLIENWAQILPHVQSGQAREDVSITLRIEAAVRAREILTLTDLPRVFPEQQPQELLEQFFVLLHRGRVRMELSREALNWTLRVEVPHDAP